jgi:arylamine N-acetyltransferase
MKLCGQGNGAMRSAAPKAEGGLRIRPNPFLYVSPRPQAMSPPLPGSARLDLPAYFDRIGYAGSREPSRVALEALHLAHATHVPFENLDILLGRPIGLDLESLQAKLVRARRGGYCFEQNLLFAAVLEALGFAVTRLAARVRLRITRALPRTHMTMIVRVDGEDWLADVGFGGDGLLLPVRFDPAAPSRQFAWTYRVARDSNDSLWVLQSLHDGGWLDLYAFSSNPSCRSTTNRPTTTCQPAPSHGSCKRSPPSAWRRMHATSCATAS